MSRFWRLLPASLALAAVFAASAPAVDGSGVRGMVRLGPITPVCTLGVPCSVPAPNLSLVFSRGGRRVTTRTDAAGRYRVRLAPGTWDVSTGARRRIGSGVTPRSVRVVPGRMRLVNLEVDTGIR
jgi:hypothetical protein